MPSSYGLPHTFMLKKASQKFGMERKMVSLDEIDTWLGQVRIDMFVRPFWFDRLV